MAVGYDDQSLLLQIIRRVYRLESLAFKQRDAVIIFYKEEEKKRKKENKRRLSLKGDKGIPLGR